MTHPVSDFSPERDEALGSALRAALDRPGDAELAARVLARAGAAGVGTSRAVLSRWTAAAVAAAVVAALVSGWLVGSEATPGASMSSYDAVWVASATGSSEAAALFTAEQAPDMETIFASLVAN